MSDLSWDSFNSYVLPSNTGEILARKCEELSPLPLDFYLRPTETVARALIGKGLYRKIGREHLLAVLVEVEAYRGCNDPASHAFRGPTPRNLAMFEPGGTCYVYLSYGINYCMNVSTQAKGTGEAVLFRAAIPLSGIKTMCRNRKLGSELTHRNIRSLLSGPGKLTQAFGIDRSQNGYTFDRRDFKLVDLGLSSARQLGKSPRIGISKAKDFELRFFVRGSQWLSVRNGTK